MFDVIADVDSYAQFLPWCVASRVRERLDGDILLADLSIGYGSLREKFTSRVTLDRAEFRVVSVQEAGPFRHLESSWTLVPDGDNQARVEFSIAFEFRSVLLDKLMGTVFESAAHRMIEAFESRAADVL